MGRSRVWETLVYTSHRLVPPMCWEEDLPVCTPALKNPVLSEVKAPERAETLHQETLGTPSSREERRGENAQLRR